MYATKTAKKAKETTESTQEMKNEKFRVPRIAGPSADESVGVGQWKAIDFRASGTGRPPFTETGSHCAEENPMIASPATGTLSPAPALNQRAGRPPASGPLLKTEAAAEYLAISPRQVQYLSDRGELPCIKMATSTRYSPADLDGFIDRCRRNGGRP